MFAPDSESFLHLTPSKSRPPSSFYLVVAVQWKPGPIVNNFYNTWWRRWGDPPCDECGSGCGMGSVDYRGYLLSWSQGTGVPRAIGRHTLSPGQAAESRTPGR